MDYSLTESTPIGIQEVVRSFERSFRANNLEAVRDTLTLPPDRVRQAIASGVFVGAGRTYDLRERGARGNQCAAEPDRRDLPGYCGRCAALGHADPDRRRECDAL